MFGNTKRLQKEKQELVNENCMINYELDKLKAELAQVKESRSKWREKAHSYRRQRTHLARQLQDKEVS